MLCTLALLAVPATFAGSKDPAAVEAKFKAMDTNGDGKISRAEHAAGAKKMFAEMDANHDGIVTAAELSSSQKGGDSSHAAMSAAEKIKAVDLDGDGQLTIAEHAAGSDSMFSKMDTDGDGFLTMAELTAGHATMKEKKQ